MESKQQLMHSLRTAYSITLPLLEDLQDAPMTPPTAHGGNHPTWLAGHLAHSVGLLVWEIMQGKPNPLADWNERFQGGSQPQSDGAVYPAYEEILSQFKSLHEEAFALLETLTEEQLDQPSKNPPPNFEEVFGTWRQCFGAMALHLTNHRGQAAVCRTALGREPLLV